MWESIVNSCLIFESAETKSIDIEFLVEDANTSHNFFISDIIINNTAQDVIRAWLNALLEQFGVQVK